MYALLKKELERDVAWKGADIDSALSRTKFNDTSQSRLFYTDDDIVARYRRCMRRADKRPGPTKFDDFDSFLDKMYFIQYYKGFEPIEDFMDCICCPLIYDSKPMLFKKLKAMIFDKSEPKYSVVRKHKIFNKYLICSGMTISLKTPDKITLVDAHLILNNVDKLNLCQNCIYAVICIIMYETTPLTEYKDILYDDTSFIFHRSLLDTDRALYDKFLKTNGTKYLKQLEHILCSNAAWYKELKN